MGQPMTIEINGEEYDATVLLVTGRDDKGRPRECTIIQPDESVDLSGEKKEFLVVYAKPGPLSGEGVS